MPREVKPFRFGLEMAQLPKETWLQDLKYIECARAETKGRNKCLEGSTFLDGAVVGSVESWDLLEGAGPDRGYMTFKVGGDIVVARYSGRTKPGGGEKYLLSGRISFLSGSGKFHGINGRASYTGWASSNRYELNWRGRYALSG